MTIPAPIIFALLAAALLAGCADTHKESNSPAAASQDRTWGGTDANIKSALAAGEEALKVACPPVSPWLLSMQKNLTAAKVTHDAEGKAQDAMKQWGIDQQKRADVAENTTAAASRTRYDIYAGLCVAVAIGATALRAYFPPVNTLGGAALKNLTTACAIGAAGFVVASMASGAVASAMVYVGPALGISLVFLVVFWAITHKKALAEKTAQLTNTVKSMNTALITAPAEVQTTMKEVMSSIQTPSTKTAVADIKAGLVTDATVSSAPAT